MVYLTLTQAAKFLGVSRTLVYRHVQQRRYAGVHQCPCGHSLLIPKPSLVRPNKPSRRPRRSLAQWPVKRGG